MGYIRGYAERLNLAAMAPRSNLSSTKHVLASTDSVHPEFLVYAPSGGNFTVNLSGFNGTIAVEWMNPATGARTAGASVNGGSTLTFIPPFNGDAVLYLSRDESGAGQK
jgi:hypothetical protein